MQGTHLRPSTRGFIEVWSCEPRPRPRAKHVPNFPTPRTIIETPGAGNTVMSRGNVMLAEGTCTSPLPRCHLRANLASGPSVPGHLRPASCSFLYSSFVDFNSLGDPDSFEYLSPTVPCIHGALVESP